jgi:hypothetical protein
VRTKTIDLHTFTEGKCISVLFLAIDSLMEAKSEGTYIGLAGKEPFHVRENYNDLLIQWHKYLNYHGGSE